MTVDELIGMKTAMRTCRELLRLLDAESARPAEVPPLMSMGAAAAAAAAAIGCQCDAAG